jgi:hypothetical protein
MKKTNLLKIADVLNSIYKEKKVYNIDRYNIYKNRNSTVI